MAVKKLKRFLRPRKKAKSYLLGEREYQHCLYCERMRVDRNHSPLSMVTIERLKGSLTEEHILRLDNLLEDRLRVNDSAGSLPDNRVGVSLPDTPQEGAWHVMTEVCNLFATQENAPLLQISVDVYQGDKINNDSDLSEEGEQPKVAAQVALEDIVAVGAGASCVEAMFSVRVPRWKRGLDIVGSITGLAIASPVILAAACAVKATSQGPMFFMQEREGLGGKTFQMLKLRTMCVDAEDQKHGLLSESVQDGPAFKLKNDPRTTTVGKLLRKFSIDELPQFWNVLIGEMSLVGPRPLPTSESRACVAWQRRRLHVLPGMTCTWQITSRNEVAFDEWVRMDIEYANDMSLKSDLQLIAKTIPSLVKSKGS